MSTFDEQQLEQAKLDIVAYQTARRELIAGKIQSYEIDSGQSRQKVTRYALGPLNAIINDLLDQIRDLEQRTAAACATIMRPI